ncbi:bacteriocin immunity protein [Lactococcus lactis]|uniref:bacteriocin immunity protein n=1 Tax=Lactococcus lactis TaxID=1358 RepID=UPI003D0B5279
MFSEKKVELTEGEKLFLGNIYDLILNPEITEEERVVLISAKTDLEKTGFSPKIINQLMLAFRGNAINRTLTKPISKFYVNLYNTTSLMDNINGATALSAAMIPIWSVRGNN